MESVEVAIVGGGVTGLAAAWRLAAAGTEVTLLERFALGHDRGSSHGATRIFRFAYDDPLYVGMAQAALPLWRELEAETGRQLLNVTGGFDVGDPAYLDRCFASLSACGAAVERLDPPERKDRFPWFEAGDAPAVFSPDTGVLAADIALEALATAAREAGADIREGAPATRIEADGDRARIATEAGELRARRCVVTAGAWTPLLLSPAGITLPVRITREQVFYFRPAAEVVPFIDRRSIARYGVPAFAGADGVKVAEHMTGEATSADGRSFDMDPEGAARVSAYVAETMPAFDPEPVAFETCLYTLTSDEDFIVDVLGPLVVCSACSGHGFKFGPVLGEALACVATGREPPVPLERFALKRFV